jgi:hypothetical protein
VILLVEAVMLKLGVAMLGVEVFNELLVLVEPVPLQYFYPAYYLS